MLNNYSSASASPLVCICMPVYNAEDTIGLALASILAQTYRDIVVHVVDNSSSDSTLCIVDSFSDSRVTVHRSKSTVSAEENFTRCIQLATGAYTALFHSDDVYHPNMVSEQIHYLENHPSVCAVFTRASLIDEHGHRFGSIGGFPEDIPHNRKIYIGQLIKAMLKHHNFLVCPSAMVRTDVYRDVIASWGNTVFASASDVDTWIRLAEHAPIAVLAKKLMSYRVSNKQFSHTNRQRIIRPDFFAVMDFHLSRPEIHSLLDSADLSNYGRLQVHDIVARSFNLFSIGQVRQAKELLDFLQVRLMVVSAFSSRRCFVTAVGYLFLVTVMPYGNCYVIRKLSRIVKQIPWR